MKQEAIRQHVDKLMNQPPQDHKLINKQQEEEFINRMMHSIKVKNFKVDTLRDELNTCTFQPQVGRAPINQQQRRNISDQLYHQGINMQNKKKMTQQLQDQRCINQHKQVFTNKKSDQVLTQMRRRRLYALFDLLLMEDEKSNDNDGLLNLYHIDDIYRSLSCLPTLSKVLDAIVPLLRNVQHMGVMDFTQFQDLLIEEGVDVDSISQQVKNVQDEIHIKLNDHQESMLTFQPVVCAKSIAIDKKLQQERNISSVVTRCEALMNFKKSSEHKRDLKRQLLIDQEMQQCTFEPKIITRRTR
ncbi:hypothetical protein AKO1_014918 [Acrasis kona]|uniref:Uncharacterized protein n=1 Tax=Acrasis kona TaxID=1008807 RepID=A0AAW2Z192_9EUKA